MTISLKSLKRRMNKKLRTKTKIKTLYNNSKDVRLPPLMKGNENQMQEPKEELKKPDSPSKKIKAPEEVKSTEINQTNQKKIMMAYQMLKLCGNCRINRT